MVTPEQNAQKWLSAGKLDQASKDEIQRLQSEDPEEFTDAFYRNLEFGTGGLRGVMGVGSNRINKYTVGMATQGLANYLLKTFPGEQISVAIAHDSRNNSRYFSEITADVFSANGIKVYLFEDLRPTPELSFAIRKLGCKSGVVLTASHNPKEYNGYKAYWDDGAQMVSPHDKNVITEVGAIASIDDVKFDGDNSLIEIIADKIDVPYLEMIKSLSLSPDAIAKEKDLKIVFSSIHGTGITMVPPALKAFGFTNVHVVEEQETPDGNFPTVIYPNPEEAEALSLALDKARKIDADLVMATDPDSDRVGIAVKDTNGEFTLLNGNQTGSLLIYYLLKKWKENGKLTGKEFVVKTIVTTELIKKLADNFDVKMYDTLTGFKFIAALIKELEGKEKFIGGGEESYGYLVGDEVRDKDAIVSCAMIAEMTAWAKSNGKGLFDLLLDIYVEHGLYLEGLRSLTKKGKSGAEEIQKMMANARANPPSKIDGSPVIKIMDYDAQEEYQPLTGSRNAIRLPKSNVLQFMTEDGSKISLRPSGTEPKIKFYFSVRSELQNKSDYFAATEKLREKIERIAESLES